MNTIYNSNNRPIKRSNSTRKLLKKVEKSSPVTRSNKLNKELSDIKARVNILENKYNVINSRHICRSRVGKRRQKKKLKRCEPKTVRNNYYYSRNRAGLNFKNLRHEILTRKTKKPISSLSPRKSETESRVERMKFRKINPNSVNKITLENESVNPRFRGEIKDILDNIPPKRENSMLRIKSYKENKGCHRPGKEVIMITKKDNNGIQNSRFTLRRPLAKEGILKYASNM